MADIVQRFLARTQDPSVVVPDPQARYFGAVIKDELVPGDNPRIGALDFDRWFAQAAARR
jgi:hypothetical protein